MIHVAFTVPCHQLRTQLPRVSQVAKCVPQGRTHIRTKPLILRDRQSEICQRPSKRAQYDGSRIDNCPVNIEKNS